MKTNVNNKVPHSKRKTMKLIKIEGHDGLVGYFNPEKITAFGIDPGPRLWIRHNGETVSVFVKVKEQFELVMEAISKLDKEEFVITGLKSTNTFDMRVDPFGVV